MKKTLFALLPFFILLFHSCDVGGVYLGTEAPFTVLTSLDRMVQAEGSILSPGSLLTPSISGPLPQGLSSADLHVRLTRVNPRDANGRILVSGISDILLATYRVGSEMETDTDTAYTEPDESDAAYLARTDLSDGSDDLVVNGEESGAGSEDPLAASTESLAADDEDGDLNGSSESTSQGDESVADDLVSDDDAGEDVVASSAEEELPFVPARYQLESLVDELPSFLLPEDLEPGPWIVSYDFVENGSIQESFSFRFLAIPVDSFAMDSLVAYPPGPDSPSRPVLRAGSMALFELSGRSPDGLDPLVKWYMSGEDLDETSFEDGRSRLLHRMPELEDEGFYSLKAEVYPLDPKAYPDFPLSPLVKTLSLAVSIVEKVEDIAAFKGSEVALFIPLRGSLEAKNKADIKLQPGLGGESPQWVPLKNDFGLLAGPKAPWFLDATQAQIPHLSSKPVRFLLDGAIQDDGQLGGGSIIFDGAKTLNWRLSLYGQTALFSLSMSGEADPLVLVLEAVRPDVLSRVWYSLDFELASGALHVRARAQGGAEASLSLPLPDAAFQAWGPLHVGYDPLSNDVSMSTAILYHLGCAIIPSFHEEITPPSTDLDENGEQFLEI